jgi:uncharacterized protein YecA (UPF0149 family)
MIEKHTVDENVDRTFVSGVSQEEIEKKIQHEANKALLDNTIKRMTVVKRVGRNEKCPCGSGKKFKKCCISKAV